MQSRTFSPAHPPSARKWRNHERLVFVAFDLLHLEGGGAAFYKAVDEMGLEGMVSKRASAPCHSGRTESWLKIKCYAVSEYEVAGVQREAASPVASGCRFFGQHARQNLVPDRVFLQSGFYVDLAKGFETVQAVGGHAPFIGSRARHGR